jgi:hypothetical protein
VARTVVFLPAMNLQAALLFEKKGAVKVVFFSLFSFDSSRRRIVVANQTLPHSELEADPGN